MYGKGNTLLALTYILQIICMYVVFYVEVVSRITLSLFWVFLSRIKVEKRRSTQAAFELLERERGRHYVVCVFQQIHTRNGSAKS